MSILLTELMSIHEKRKGIKLKPRSDYEEQPKRIEKLNIGYIELKKASGRYITFFKDEEIYIPVSQVNSLLMAIFQKDLTIEDTEKVMKFLGGE